MKLTTIEIHFIKGRGLIHIVDMPDDFLYNQDPRTLVGSKIILDGSIRKVRSVETFAVPWYPNESNLALKRVGLQIEAVIQSA